ncbi:MAG: Ig-like domain-containing protein [Candidatus Magasanikbacteria bacterium]|nr:Ig-like domain-containing protein [Candidatus Magasanikbacteria bacterium]
MRWWYRLGLGLVGALWGASAALAAGPVAVSSSPVNGATEVATTTEPFIVFSEPLNPGSITARNLQLRQFSDDVAVTTTLNLSDEGSQVVFRPILPLPFATQFYLWFGTGVKDQAGEKVAERDAWYKDDKNRHQFTTEAAPAEEAVSSTLESDESGIASDREDAGGAPGRETATTSPAISAADGSTTSSSSTLTGDGKAAEEATNASEQSEQSEASEEATTSTIKNTEATGSSATTTGDGLPAASDRSESSGTSTTGVAGAASSTTSAGQTASAGSISSHQSAGSGGGGGINFVTASALAPGNPAVTVAMVKSAKGTMRLLLTAVNNPEEMLIATDASFPLARWLPYAPVAVGRFGAATGGTTTVYVKFRNAVGESAVASVSFYVNRPSLLAVSAPADRGFATINILTAAAPRAALAPEAVRGIKISRPDELIASLKFGERRAAVKELQRELKRQGWFPRRSRLTTYYGPVTRRAVQRYRAAAGRPSTP